MADTTLTDMGPFFQRYDQGQRLLLATTLCASLVLSAVIFTHIVDATRGRGPVLAVQWFPIVFFPLFIVVWWSFTELTARARRKASQPDGRHPASPDAALNVARIAKAGFVFNIAWTASMLGSQAVATLAFFGYFTGDLIPRATTVALGAGTICLGNVWPRMPTPTVPEWKAARRMKANRLAGWMMVIIGLLMVLLGLFLPLVYPWIRR